MKVSFPKKKSNAILKKWRRWMVLFREPMVSFVGITISLFYWSITYIHGRYGYRSLIMSLFIGRSLLGFKRKDGFGEYIGNLSVFLYFLPPVERETSTKRVCGEIEYFDFNWTSDVMCRHFNTTQTVKVWGFEVSDFTAMTSAMVEKDVIITKIGVTCVQRQHAFAYRKPTSLRWRHSKCKFLWQLWLCSFLRLSIFFLPHAL